MGRPTSKASETQCSTATPAISIEDPDEVIPARFLGHYAFCTFCGGPGCIGCSRARVQDLRKTQPGTEHYTKLVELYRDNPEEWRWLVDAAYEQVRLLAVDNPWIALAPLYDACWPTRTN